ncbi:MAG: helix-turn-helix domain-containing protein [Gammaproteobacteria bacterium]|nr:helix-turn-helix domain-containing protein [Gammaproteobacteria bacterium]
MMTSSDNTISAEVYHRAYRSRDARFDGKFFIGVLSTGIYCRPICPALPPKPENVRFYPTAAAAAGAGYRPCLRCRPETSPGTPAWLGTSATVSRALRLINNGALDDASVEDLATRMGITSRHLYRLFMQHIGASPKTVAETRRLHFAKKLIDETQLSMGEIALASGFGSVRRFNDVMRKVYQRTPRELRNARINKTKQGGEELILKLSYRPPFDWPAALEYLKIRAVPGVEAVTDSGYQRSFDIEGEQGRVAIQHADKGHYLIATINWQQPIKLLNIVERVRRLFDLGCDPLEVAAHLRGSPILSELVERYPGVRVPGAWEGFELAVRAILGQQVSVKGAATLAGRLVEVYGELLRAPFENLLTHTFPTAAKLAHADIAADVGMPGARANAIRALAQAVTNGDIDLSMQSDPQKLHAKLTTLPGIGEWTADYITMRALHEPDAFPAGDLGVKRALSEEGKNLPVNDIKKLAEAWRPWRAYATVLLWKKYSID